MVDKTGRKRKRWLPAAILLVIAIVASVGLFFYLQAPDPTKMTAEETLALYMKYWQKHDYDQMIDMIYPPYRELFYGGDQAIITFYENQEVAGVVDIESDPSRDYKTYDAYDQTGLCVTYLLPTIGGSSEQTKYYYVMIQPEKNGVWYIGDGGPGP